MKMNDLNDFSANLIKAQLLSATTISIFADKYIDKAKELANKVVNSL